jgi:hypothetical protein
MHLGAMLVGLCAIDLADLGRGWPGWGLLLPVL